MKDRCATHPQPARLVVRVGVTGHRTDALLKLAADSDCLRKRIGQVLDRLCTIARNLHKEAGEVYTQESPLMRLISPLAEGADRLVAEEALARGYELQALLPFPREQYEETFAARPGSKDQFETLLTQATTVLELGGAPKPFHTVGHILLLQCDLLIAVWNGAPAQGEGGTGQVVEDALQLKIPTLRIEASPPHRACFWQAGEQSGDPPRRGNLKALLERLRVALLPPPHPVKERHASLAGRMWRFFLPPPTVDRLRIERFFKEKPPAWKWGAIFLAFRYLWTGEWEDPRKRKKLRMRLPVRALGTPIEWADNLAEYYAGLYRSSFVVAYLMGACAVLTALVGIVYEDLSRLSFSAELVFISCIIGITLLGRREGWHERWMDYRLLTEALRQMEFLSPIGLVPPSFKVPVHLEPGDPQRSWSNWHFHALVREAGLKSGQMNIRYLAIYQEKVLQPMIARQVKYHSDNHKVFERLHHRPHLVAQLLFGLAAIACLLHVIGGWCDSFELLLSFAAIVLPAFGGALAAILHHGEFERLALRSRALGARLKLLQKDASVAGLTSSQLSRIAEDLSDVMMAELVDWRFVFLDKNLILPA
jgi:hypothetical protein